MHLIGKGPQWAPSVRNNTNASMFHSRSLNSLQYWYFLFPAVSIPRKWTFVFVTVSEFYRIMRLFSISDSKLLSRQTRNRQWWTADGNMSGETEKTWSSFTIKVYWPEHICTICSPSKWSTLSVKPRDALLNDWVLVCSMFWNHRILGVWIWTWTDQLLLC